MLSFTRKYLSVLIMSLVFVYAAGDYFSLWDDLSGRTSVLRSWERLTLSQGWPKVIIFDDDPVFDVLCAFIEKHSTNDSIRVHQQLSVRPTAIARMWGTQTPALGDQPPEWPSFRQALQSSPVVFVYKYSKAQISKRDGIQDDQVYFACTLSDLRNWVSESRSSEQFWVLTVFLGLLSLAVAIYEKRTEPESSSTAD